MKTIFIDLGWAIGRIEAQNQIPNKTLKLTIVEPGYEDCPARSIEIDGTIYLTRLCGKLRQSISDINEENNEVNDEPTPQTSND